ncbi:hypothetical protein V8E55_007379 [Tylopilus felleus]
MSSTGTAVQLGPTYGAELLAAFVAVALWGTTCMQTLIYFIQYPKDRLVLKALVVWLWQVILTTGLQAHNTWNRLADTVHQILIVKGVYDSQIVGFCDYHRIQTVVPEFLSLVALTSQTFFTHRIWRFNGTPWFYWAILYACLNSSGFLFSSHSGSTIIPTAAELISPAPAALFVAIQAVSAAADLTIAACLTILLIQRNGRALKSTRSLLQKLLVLTINTGIWTALFAVFCFVAMVAFKRTLIYAAVYFPLCALYCNTVLANLNARDFLMECSAVTEGGTIDGVYLGPIFATSPQTTVATQSMDRRLTVQVEVNKSVKYDDEESVLRTRESKTELKAEGT